MKALSPGRPPVGGQRLGILPSSRGMGLLGSSSSSSSKGSSASPSHSSSLEVDPLSLLYNMNDCYSKLKELVPSIPNNKKVSRMEILQHVIDYILDLQIALDSSSSNSNNNNNTHLVSLQQQQQHCPARNNPSSSPSGSSSSSSSRSPLAALNTDITILSLQAAEFPSELMSNDSKALCG